MYFREYERMGDYGEDTSLRGPGLGTAVLAPIAGAGALVAAIVATLQVIALVAAAIAAAYLLIKAYERARSLGIGVDWAGQALQRGMAAVLQQARRLIRELQRLLEEASRRPQRPPECDRLIAFLRERLARMIAAVRAYHGESTLPVVEIERMKALCRVVEDSISNMPHMIQMLRNCFRV